MTKKYLFLTLPLLFLTSCGNVEVSAQEEIQYKEAVENVDEIFGEGFSLDKRDNLRMKLAEAANVPVLGFQNKTYTKGGNDYYAIRFIAALSSEAVSAVWTRNVYNGATWTKVTEQDDKKSTVFYDKLYDGKGSEVYANDVETGYEKFAIYTMYDIPVAKADNLYIQAYITVDGVTSKVGVASKKQKFTVDYGTTDYFMVIGEGANVNIVDDNVTKTNPDNKAEFSKNLTVEDSFGFIAVSSNNIELINYSKLHDDDTYFKNAGDDIHFKTKFTGEYTFYINGVDEIYVSATNVKKTLYFTPGVWDVGGAWFALYLVDTNGEGTWHDLTKVNDSLYRYDTPLNTTTYPKAVFVRLDPATSEPTWDEKLKWDQTNDLEFSWVQKYNQCNITGWGSEHKATVNWEYRA